jgi:toxin YoeB
MKNIIFTNNSYKDFIDWSATDKKIFARIDELIKSISRTPFAGIGKPEPLKHELSGFWSRKINDEHRLVYRINADNEIEIASCKNHY